MKKLKLADREISTELDAFVMGILNVTPDSFFDKSRGGIEIAKKLIADGADIIDIGGESTRPGSEYVPAEEEIKRVVPVIKEIRKFSNIPVSVDTRKLEVMKAAYEAGADILNDVSALEDDPGLADFAAEKGIPVILMHKRGNPVIMQKNTEYKNIYEDVNQYLKERCEFALSKGIKQDKIIIDPGIGFGKDTDGCGELIKNCGRFCDGKYMVLMALSRKTCLGNVTGNPVEERLNATVCADLISVMNGAEMIRVHDVKEAVDSLKILKWVNNERV